jgi:hypothetical protein
MKIFEILSAARKTIKILNKLYIAYTMDNSKYDELVEFIEMHKTSSDPNIRQEIMLMQQKLIAEFYQILLNTRL